MTTKSFAQLLIEGPEAGPLLGLSKGRPGIEPKDGQSAKANKKVTVYLNRLLLRIFSVPSLMSYLKDVALLPAGDEGGSLHKIQLVFQRLPDEVYPQLLRLLAAPKSPQLTKFLDQGQARTGVEISVTPEDFGGEDYDYAM